ncbi:protein PIF-like [Haliotis asinina]|uniref:protein PIF-like n=1 Tax=Haliotis asinina TaxID=109174 RepID=UPI00353247E9
MFTLILCLFLHVGLGQSQHASHAFAIDLQEMCEECDTSTGSGYVNHPKYCHLFIHCSRGANDKLRGEVKECTRGLLWSQTVKQCVWPSESDCPSNPCYNQSLSFRDLRNCNGYFTCPSAARLLYNCCPRDERFDESQGMCVPSPGCNDPCLPGSSNTSAEAPECKRYPHPEDKHKYIWQTGGTNATFSCAQGTAFSVDSCSCTDPVDLTNIGKCEPYIYFPFDHNVKDKLGRTASGGIDSWIQRSEPASVGGGSVYFNGHRQVIAWALNNMEFKSNFTLYFRFKADFKQSQKGERFALVDNSDCEKEATFGIALLRSGPKAGSVHGGFRLKNGQAVTTSSREIPLNIWHEVILLKKGPVAELRVDDEVYPIEGIGLEADISRVDCSMTIGKGTGLVNFVGYIDELKFYKCVPPEYVSK